MKKENLYTLIQSLDSIINNLELKDEWVKSSLSSITKNLELVYRDMEQYADFKY